MSVLLVLASGIAHAIWNMLTKRSDNKQIFLLLILIPSTLLLFPVFANELLHQRISGQGYFLLLMSLMVQAVYGFLLSKSLANGDMSQVYPMMRGISAFLLPLIGSIFLRETLSLWGWIGLLFIAAGFCLTSGIGSKRHRQAVSSKVIWYTVGVGLCTMSYVLIDKINLRHFSPITLLEVSNMGFILGLVSFIKKDEIRAVVQGKNKIRLLLLGSVLSPGSYLLFLLAMDLSPLTYIAPLREFGTVFGAFAGIYLLKERKEVIRLVSAGVIFAGILLIGIWGD
ncbi:EamA family transporter [Cohnella faecalis]|uniref:DMT family transporter n=1 Tax=Cohnella faecalis TaxID=2315694 RepID=UPI001F3640CE|nr:DMT family transporter [Cohnella faecalis]